MYLIFYTKKHFLPHFYQIVENEIFPHKFYVLKLNVSKRLNNLLLINNNQSIEWSVCNLWMISNDCEKLRD